MFSSTRHSAARVAFLAAFTQLLATACDPTAPNDPSQRDFVPGASRIAGVPGLTASVVSWREIDLSWPTSPSANGYQVFRSTTGAAGAYTQIATAASRYGDVGLTSSTQYCYEVRSLKYTGKTISYAAFSTPACATTLPPPINPPSEIGAVPQAGGILVSWKDNSNNEDGFRVEPSSGGSFTVPASTTTYFYGYSAAEQQTCFRVYAFNADVSIPSATTGCATIPAGPTGLLATALDAKSITLAWIDNSKFEDGYKVYRSDNLSAFTEIATLPPNVVTYRDVGVQADVSYTYHVQAVKDGGYSYNSNDAVGVIPTSVPAAPTSVEASYRYDVAFIPPYATLLVTWSDNSTNEAGFRIEASWDGVSDWQTYRETGANKAYSEETFLSWGGDGGCFRVIAVNALGDSSPSNVFCTVPYTPETGN